MILALDIGNSNIVIGVIDKNKIYCVERIFTDLNKTASEYDLKLKNILDLYNISIEQIDGTIISSVVPMLNDVLKSAVKKLTNKNIILVDDKIKTNINFDSKFNQKEIGSDLICATVGAINAYTPPLAIIDMGTATTITIVDKNNCFLGGMILPGVKISMKALVSSTAQLPEINLSQPQSFIATNTIDCMKSGLIYSNACIVDGMIERIEKELNQNVTSIATGGLCEYILPYCKSNIIFDNNLILKGLYYIYECNS